MRQAQQIMDYAANHYATQPEYLWAKFPDYGDPCATAIQKENGMPLSAKSLKQNWV